MQWSQQVNLWTRINLLSASFTVCGWTKNEAGDSKLASSDLALPQHSFEQKEPLPISVVLFTVLFRMKWIVCVPKQSLCLKAWQDYVSHQSWAKNIFSFTSTIDIKEISDVDNAGKQWYKQSSTWYQGLLNLERIGEISLIGLAGLMSKNVFQYLFEAAWTAERLKSNLVSGPPYLNYPFKIWRVQSIIFFS